MESRGRSLRRRAANRRGVHRGLRARRRAQLSGPQGSSTISPSAKRSYHLTHALASRRRERRTFMSTRTSLASVTQGFRGDGQRRGVGGARRRPDADRRRPAAKTPLRHRRHRRARASACGDGPSSSDYSDSSSSSACATSTRCASRWRRSRSAWPARPSPTSTRCSTRRSPTSLMVTTVDAIHSEYHRQGACTAAST